MDFTEAVKRVVFLRLADFFEQMPTECRRTWIAREIDDPQLSRITRWGLKRWETDGFRLRWSGELIPRGRLGFHVNAKEILSIGLRR